MDIYRKELIETQKARTDLLKWKVIIIAAIAAASLGITCNNGAIQERRILLCFIPLACLYIDMLHFSLGLRIDGIAAFLRAYTFDPRHFHDYEQFLFGARMRADYKRFRLLKGYSSQTLILCSSSLIITLIVFIYSTMDILFLLAADSTAASDLSIANAIVPASVVLGFILYCLMLYDHKTRRDAMDAIIYEKQSDKARDNVLKAGEKSE